MRGDKLIGSAYIEFVEYCKENVEFKKQSPESAHSLANVIKMTVIPGIVRYLS